MSGHGLLLQKGSCRLQIFIPLVFIIPRYNEAYTHIIITMNEHIVDEAISLNLHIHTLYLLLEEQNTHTN